MNEQTYITIISAAIALLSTVFTGIVAYRKTKSEQDNTLALSDRSQNVELVQGLRQSNTTLEKDFAALLLKFQEIQVLNSETRVKLAFMDSQRETWQRERETWQRERETWQLDRVGFEKERREWIKERDSWEDERIDLINRIRELESKLNKLEENAKS